MTSISSTQYSHSSPRTMMDNRISAAVSAGSISATDQTALGSALDTIDSSLAADRASGSKPSGNIKDRVDSLIDAQVKAGSLTDDQASELKDFFSRGPDGTSGAGGEDSGDQIAMGGVGGACGAGGPHPSRGSKTDDDSSSSSATGTDSASAQLDTLIAFLEKLRGSMASSTYGASSGTSTSSADSSHSGLLVNAMA